MDKISLIFAHLLVGILFICLSCIAGTQVSLTHVDSYGSYSKSEIISRGVERATSRHEAIRSTLEQSSTLNGQSRLQSSGSSYLMELSIGTPPVPLVSIMDTGSNLIWTQCVPCIHCFQQTTPIFNPAKSTSFNTVSCNSDACTRLQFYSRTTCTSAKCQYTYGYADKSSTTGSLSKETFTFASKSGSVSVPNVVFGCSTNSTESFDNTSGIVGLSMGDFSLIDYLDSPKFSYCLTPLLDMSTSTLLLGSGACLISNNALSIPIVINPRIPSLYYLNLKGISIGGDTLQIPTNSFNINSDGTGGVIIDSGSTFTGLISSAYVVVREKVGSIVNLPLSKYTVDPAIDLCFESKSNSMPNMPDMIFHFDTGDFIVPKENYMLLLPGSGLLCLAMIEFPTLSIFGAYQQQNTHILYNVGNKMLSFEQAQCNKPQQLQCGGTNGNRTTTFSSGRFSSSPSLFFLILQVFVALIFT
ncbi:aspartic proteinase nepenthesin-1-like [Carex rostrata]